MNKGSKVAVAIALLALTSKAIGAEPGFYVGAGLGETWQEMGDSNGIAVGFGFPIEAVRQEYPEDVQVEDGNLGWQTTIGYRLNRYLAAEVAYLSFAQSEITEVYSIDPGFAFPVPPLELRREYSSKVAGPALSVLGSLPLGRFDLFLKAGMLFADQDVALGGNVVGSREMTFGEEVWFAGAGVDWSVADRWMLRAEYLRTAKLAATLVSAATEVETLSFSVFFRL
jgi:hypothetical protein